MQCNECNDYQLYTFINLYTRKVNLTLDNFLKIHARVSRYLYVYICVYIDICMFEVGNKLLLISFHITFYFIWSYFWPKCRNAELNNRENGLFASCLTSNLLLTLQCKSSRLSNCTDSLFPIILLVLLL